ncbi:PatB family C-S lyase [Allohahella marinimesophila]|uniref:cysteine-S-conjugate beta-lyase n=1 Tax=Allohahella marinimesophila TaxID=1054972 RepID=A0ABP7NHQ6_9GAMM
MHFDFDEPIARAGTNSVKFDARKAVFGVEDIIPLWVADTDFAVPPAISEALLKRAKHPNYGYSLAPDSLYQAMINWFARRHQFPIERASIMLAPGVVPSIHAAVLALTQPDDAIVIQTPVYAPFFNIAAHTGRRLVENPLRLVDQHYEMDFDHLERCAQDGARLLILCSPHNPVGRVWRRDELSRLLAIADAYDMIVVADEIHCDLVFEGHAHTPLALLTDRPDRVITTLAPSKSFNVPGLGLSALVVSDGDQRKALGKVFASLHIEMGNPFSLTACEAAYAGGEAWLDEMMKYVDGNRQFVISFLQNHVPDIRVMPSEGTYLLWLDCRSLCQSRNWDDRDLKHFFVNEASIGMNPGITFGKNGSGFMRMNIGTQRSVLKEALLLLQQALHRNG